MEQTFRICFQDALSRFLSPLTCVQCGKPSGRSVPICRVCELAYTAFTVESAERCSRCGRILISAQELCVDCRTVGAFEAIDAVLPLYPYDMVAQQLVAEWKMAANFAMTSVFAGWIAEHLQQFPDVPLVPVPPRPGKIRKKGWDQIDLLVRELEKRHHRSVLRCLYRTTGLQQKQLGRAARLTNLRGAIAMKGKRVLPKTVILVDDLMTTGATIDACAAVLKENGCSAVYAVTLFYD